MGIAIRYLALFLVAALLAGPVNAQPGTSADDPQRLFSGDLEKMEITDSEAVCNDGSQATLYLRRNPGSKLWIVALPGGEACTDRKTCGVYLSRHAKPAGCGQYDPTPGTPDCSEPQPATRAKALLSSDCDAATRRGAGLLSPDSEVNPYFYDANAVWLRYCSSDYWIGLKPASEPEGEEASLSTSETAISFMGQKILFAGLEDLFGYGMADATHVLIVGNATSGAIGLLWHGDRIADFIKERVPDAKVRLVADSAWMLDHDTYPRFEGECRDTDPVSCPLAKELRKAVEAYQPEDPEGWVPEGCGTVEEAWLCLTAKHRVRMLRTPMFHAQYLYDIGQLGLDQFPDASQATDGDWGWARSAVARQFVRDFETLNNGLFAVSCYQHGFLTLDAWRDVKVPSDGEKIDVSEALYRWLQDEPARFIDEDYEHVFCKDTKDEHCNRTCKPCTYPPDPT